MSKNILLPLNWRWAGMGYRLNGDGYAIFKNDLTGQRARVGASEAGWDPKTETYKMAAHRAMWKRQLSLEGV